MKDPVGGDIQKLYIRSEAQDRGRAVWTGPCAGTWGPAVARASLRNGPEGGPGGGRGPSPRGCPVSPRTAPAPGGLSCENTRDTQLSLQGPLRQLGRRAGPL